MARGSLSWLILAFIRLCALLAPAVWWSRYIGYWALLPCAVFWVLVAVALRKTRKHLAGKGRNC